MKQGKTLLVLGGGIGGIAAARALRRHLRPPHRVVLVDRERAHVFAPSLLWVMVGLREAESIQRSLARLARKDIEVRLGEIEKIDPGARCITMGGAELGADYMVVSLGAELAPEGVPGLVDAGHNFYTLAGAERFRDEVREWRGGRIVVLTAAPAYKCPAAPYEAAMLIDHFCRRQGTRAASTLDVYAAEPAPMVVAGPAMSAAVVQMLAAKGIGYHPGHQVEAVDPATKRIAFAGGANSSFDLLAYVPPHRAPRVVRQSSLAGENGWISVDRHTLATPFQNVYAIGDVVSIPLALGKPLPKAGVFAHAEAEVVARNVAGEITGRGKPQRFMGHGECFVEVGGGRAAFGGGDFYAEPLPLVKLRPAGRRWHFGKVWFEKSWLYGKL